MAPTHPEILYAQRSSDSEAEKNIIYVTIQTPNIEGEPTLDIQSNKIHFHAKCGNQAKGVPEKEYEFDLDLYDALVPEETKKHITSRAVILILRKAQLQTEFWPRLTKEKVKNNWIKTDFSKWVDEDEQDAADAFDDSEFSGMGGPGGPGGPPGMGGMSGMGGMGGMGGAGGMDLASMMGGMGGGGAGGPGGMDFASMMGGMGGAGGAGGAGGMDFAKMMEQMGGAGGAGGPGGANFGDSDSEDEGEVEAEDEEESKAGGSGSA